MIFQKKIITWKLEKKQDYYISQAMANELWADKQMDIAERYSDVMKTVFISFVYAPLFAPGLIIGCIAIGLLF